MFVKTHAGTDLDTEHNIYM